VSREEVELPDEPVQRITAPVQRFLHVETAGGVVLLAAAVVALVAANSPFAETFLAFWKTAAPGPRAAQNAPTPWAWSMWRCVKPTPTTSPSAGPS
jgi:NhaA family Na+:H+ antiporter